MVKRLSTTLLLLLLAAATGRPASVPTPSVIARIMVGEDGVFRVTDRSLRAAGVTVPDRAIDSLTLSVSGTPVPLLLERPGGDDGRFAMTFIGTFPRGEKAYENEFNVRSPYMLSLADGGAPRLHVEAAPLPREREPDTWSSPYRDHLELNTKLFRFTGKAPHDDYWYWAEIRGVDPEPTRVEVRVTRVAAGTGATLRVHLQGYSHLESDPDHHVAVSWDGEALGTAAWDGEEPSTFEAPLPSALLTEGVHTLALEATTTADVPIDLALLDWIELDYEQTNELGERDQMTLRVAPGTTTTIARVGVGPLRIFGFTDGSVLEVNGTDDRAAFGAPRHLREAQSLYAVRRPLAPAAIVAARPRDLTAGGADFVIITHESLEPAAEILAAARRREGLTTVVVRIGDVYDGFSHGFLTPYAIRDFMLHAWQSWSPRPRYLLLLGDASWDYKNRTVDDANYPDWHWSKQWHNDVPKIPSTPYEGVASENRRLLVPTYQYPSFFGHAASDNLFACLDGDDAKPDIAVGRIPAATLAEARATIEKILAHEASTDSPSALFVTNDEPAFQQQADGFAQRAGSAGFAVECVYPKAEEKDNLVNTQALRHAFDRGQALLVFIGHGGRYIWRTGPPDISKNHDLFTLDDLDALSPTSRLPIVMSLTCYSAPFDHPVADSIGEKLLRLPDRGAIAVVAASWRHNAAVGLGEELVRDLVAAQGTRIGDAYLTAKRAMRDDATIYLYNLLGDPTTRFQRPATTAR